MANMEGHQRDARFFCVFERGEGRKSYWQKSDNMKKKLFILCVKFVFSLYPGQMMQNSVVILQNRGIQTQKA